MLVSSLKSPLESVQGQIDLGGYRVQIQGEGNLYHALAYMPAKPVALEGDQKGFLQDDHVVGNAVGDGVGAASAGDVDCVDALEALVGAALAGDRSAQIGGDVDLPGHSPRCT